MSFKWVSSAKEDKRGEEQRRNATRFDPQLNQGMYQDCYGTIASHVRTNLKPKDERGEKWGAETINRQGYSGESSEDVRAGIPD